MTGWQFWVDRGGTFTDIVALSPSGQQVTHKLLSVIPEQYTNSAIQGIRDILGLSYEQAIPTGEIESVKVGTTVATNALLERKGETTALAITKGFKDALRIANQNRPDIFALKIDLPELLYSDVVEINERILVSGEIEQALDVSQARVQFENLYHQGYRSIAIVLIHSWKNPQHEQALELIARQVGFEQISLSHQASQTIKLIPRGDTAVVDAYLTPVMQAYVQQIAQALEDVPLFFMQSNGALAVANQFNGKDAILSGPAGGIVGAVKTCHQAGYNKIIGFDMGGTSTDVSHYAGELERSYHNEIAGVRISAPVMDIHTVAAGGGSICQYLDGRFQVGPESAGASPGPACYRNGGPLTVTDCNLVIGKLQPEIFPKVFGKNANLAIDPQASLQRIIEIQQALKADKLDMSVEQIAQGFIELAVENMANAVRKISTQRGYDLADYALSSFGGAGGQHACLIADSLEMNTILIHPYAGVLSAFGIGLAEQGLMSEISIQLPLIDASYERIEPYLEPIRKTHKQKLTQFNTSQQANPLSEHLIALVKYQGAEVRLEVPFSQFEQMKADFEQAHLKEFGYLSHADLVLDAISIEHRLDEGQKLTKISSVESFTKPDINAEFVYYRDELTVGQTISGPALIVEKTGTNYIEQGWQAEVIDNLVLRLTKHTSTKTHDLVQEQQSSMQINPIKLEMFNNLFMSIAEQMGLKLAKTAHSVNIKERLDFSCALFNKSGELIANAPHVPVHLGSMSHSVLSVIEQNTNMQAGQSFLINSPYAGGTHLPDLTLVTPVFLPEFTTPSYYIASRAHHADVGGITPGSMPANSQNINQEGILFSGEIVAENHQLDLQKIKQLFQQGEFPARNIEQNIADLAAQLAANLTGEQALISLTQAHSEAYIQALMNAILDNGELAVENALNQLKDGEYCLALDNQSQIKVSIKLIQSELKRPKAVIDFTGTSAQQASNFNAPRSVVDAAVIYVFRCLVDKPMPLNAGCMRPLDVIVEQASMLSPVYPAAVVAGNVEVSQAIVTSLLLALDVQSGSQTTMNNLSFGNQTYQYYETIAGGTGAGKLLNGELYSGTDAVHSHMTNSRLTDPEIIEQRMPVVIRNFLIREKSGGQGQVNGGNGLIRELEFLTDLEVNILSNSRIVAPAGLNGAANGSTGSNILFKKTGEEINLASNCHFSVSNGDRLKILTPGGGGYKLKAKH
ncbi:hydantoinase B/oxoprolinase family protein [Catenovulum maritimum]|uniref:ATP-hydrolysing 5-oxoprolinase n=1 Tax=Catenovulum maritimum TaxID=1513271 RepID=A0A0J8GQY1_9ALTE|nr:hydantoinase B/oxoprolinase family protein [Catenovulum maritimum]KMT65240.1 ATP-hydrolysing 5-oxoprolinase [Catenovulum maritimum]